MNSPTAATIDSLQRELFQRCRDRLFAPRYVAWMSQGDWVVVTLLDDPTKDVGSPARYGKLSASL